MSTAYPLAWPPGWPRTDWSRRSRSLFKMGKAAWENGSWRGASQVSMERATRFVRHEIDLMRGASGLIISTNVKLRNDGLPYSQQAQPKDPGAAVYFQLKGRPVSLACDKWNRVEDNVYAIGKHIESLRAQDRWGVGTLEQAFAGFMALPYRTEKKPWWEVLRVPETANDEVITAQYRKLAKDLHPDSGGSDDAMAELNNAYETALAGR